MICVLAGQLGSPKQGPAGSGSFASMSTLSPDDLEKLKEAVMAQLKQSSYARPQNDDGDALSGLDSSLASGGKQSGSDAPKWLLVDRVAGTGLETFPVAAPLRSWRRFRQRCTSMCGRYSEDPLRFPTRMRSL